MGMYKKIAFFFSQGSIYDIDASSDSRLVACVADDRSLALFERLSSSDPPESGSTGPGDHTYSQRCHAFAHAARPWRVRLVQRAREKLVLTAGEVPFPLPSIYAYWIEAKLFF